MIEEEEGLLKELKDRLALRKLTHKSTEPQVKNLVEAISRQDTNVKTAQGMLFTMPVDADAEHGEFEALFGKVLVAARNGSYFRRVEETGAWTDYNETNVKKALMRMSVSSKVDSRDGTSPLDRAILFLQDYRKVQWWGELAGYSEGPRSMNEMLILVEKSTKLIEVAPGDWGIVRQWIEGMLGEDRLQINVFYGWLKAALESLERCLEPVESIYDGTVRYAPGHFLVLAGPGGAGKSLIQELVITPLLGNRETIAQDWMSGATEFNDGFERATHLRIEDVGGNSIKDRELFTDRVKQAAVNTSMRLNGKNKPAATLAPYHRTTMSINDNPKYLRGIPVLDETVKDKIIILLCKKMETQPLPGNTEAERTEIKRVFAEQIPAFAWFLKHEFSIPPDLVDRGGLKAYHNEEVVAKIEDIAPDQRLYSMLTEVCLRQAGKVTQADLKMGREFKLGNSQQIIDLLSTAHANVFKASRMTECAVEANLYQLYQDKKLTAKNLTHGRRGYSYRIRLSAETFQALEEDRKDGEPVTSKFE
jgi:hypothetical protein